MSVHSWCSQMQIHPTIPWRVRWMSSEVLGGRQKCNQIPPWTSVLSSEIVFPGSRLTLLATLLYHRLLFHHLQSLKMSSLPEQFYSCPLLYVTCLLYVHSAKHKPDINPKTKQYIFSFSIPLREVDKSIHWTRKVLFLGQGWVESCQIRNGILCKNSFS